MEIEVRTIVILAIVGILLKAIAVQAGLPFVYMPNLLPF